MILQEIFGLEKKYLTIYFFSHTPLQLASQMEIF